MKWSVVIPCYNEEGSVKELYQRLLKVLGQETEIIFVDDGSTDTTFEILQTLHPVKIIRLRKNFGQTAALDAGIKAARGEYIITLDADLQNPPEEIPKLIQKIQEGYDVVSGWRKKRSDAVSKHIISRGANMLRKFFIDDGIHDSGCTLKIYRKECFENLDLFGEIHRFIPGILKWQGFHVTEIPVKHDVRKSGTSKYQNDRILKGFVDMIGVWFWRKFSSRPLHLFGGTGVIFFFIGSFMLLVLAILRALEYISLSDRIWPLIAIFFILAGLQLFVSGIMSEILIRNYFRDSHRPYTIKEVVEN